MRPVWAPGVLVLAVPGRYSVVVPYVTYVLAVRICALVRLLCG